ncbi:uncharacterized protein ARMOST_19159 [Armillaria ostoyae]|uniref:JmjC domain-containing protein n=1 Tax=Armillaria ostoyae TaxID=47428 RepID=A0A284S3S6_ARMOS|nr:uncharacterized protein ARMOST_19159 [Armillaria ostoyae]
MNPKKEWGLGFCRLDLSLTSIGMRKRVRVPDDEVDPGLRASRKWAAKQDPAVLREKNRLSKQRIRALKKVGLNAFDASKRASPGHGLYTTFRHTPRPDPTPSTSASLCTELNIIYENPHPTAIDPVLMESSPTRHQTVECCDEQGAHSPDHSLSESRIPEAICVDDPTNVTSTSARTVVDPAYIYDPSFVTGDALYGATFPASSNDEDIRGAWPERKLHHDAEGHSTAIVGQKGVKFWSILTLKPQYRSLPRTELFDKLADINQPNQQGTSNYLQLCDIETVKLRPGDVLLQPPGSFHRPSIGRRSLDMLTLGITEVLDIEHDDPSGYQTLLQMLLAMQAMGSRLFYKRALSAHCLMILAPEDYVYQRRSLQKDFNGNEEKQTYRTKKIRLEEIRSLLHYEHGIEYADQIRLFLGFQTRDSLRSYVHNFKGDGPDELVSIVSINPPVS